MSIHVKKSSNVAGPGLLAVIAVALWLVSVPAGAVPQIMTEYGDQVGWRSGDINAMGGTGVALYRGGMSNIFNPSYLAREAGHRFDASVSVDQESEDRFLPLFDTFDNYVTDVAIASNRQHYWQTGFGFAMRLLEGSIPLSVGLSLTDRYNFSYTFEEEVRNPFIHGSDYRDLLLEYRERKVTGTLRNLSLGAGAGLHDRISFGAAVHYAFGTRTETNSVRDQFIDPEDPGDVDESYNDNLEYDLSGVNFTLGLSGKITERVEIGLSWESQLTASGDFSNNYVGMTDTTSSTHDGSYRYPNYYRFGLTFRPQTDPRTEFSLECQLVPWSEMVDSENSGDGAQELQDVVDVRIGLQHTFYNNVPVRFGFRYYDSYKDRDSSGSVFSAGSGVPFGAGIFDISVELMKITSVQDHQFPYPDEVLGDNFYSDPQARVEDTRFRVGVGYKVEF